VNVKVCGFPDAGSTAMPPIGGGFDTVTSSTAPAASAAAGMRAVSCVELTNVVAYVDEPIVIVGLGFESTKLPPLIVSVKSPLPAPTVLGTIPGRFAVAELRNGTGFVITNVSGLLVPPPGAGFVTVTSTCPPTVTNAAGTVTWICWEVTSTLERTTADEDEPLGVHVTDDALFPVVPFRKPDP
jgi:hypothetical protein